MAWNSSSNKSIDLGANLSAKKAAPVSVGAPIAYNIFNGGGGYHDAWDITKAYSEGMRKVTWVFRCIDVISSNQAMLPVILRKDNNPFGEIVHDDRLLNIFNNTSNVGENAFAFRYRLSSQLLMSSRGAFVEIVRGRGGMPIALHLLPPQHTSPIPDINKFVSGFEVTISPSEKRVIRPENVIWIRRPHPLDPYLSMTPMEAAGVAIELENLAKIYNRNFLLNDGRPGGLLVLRSEIAEEDKEELRSRFRGNIARAGSIGVISSDDGADFVDTAASPRDAAYIQMRTITKEEILAAFGVPESIIGNSSGRCLHQDELVRLSSGERVPAVKLAGSSFKLFTSTSDGHVEVDAWATFEQFEPTFKVTTESGRTLMTNGKHPLYAGRYVRTRDMNWRSCNGPGIVDIDWTPVASLTTDHVVAVPTFIDSYGSSEGLTPDEGFILGALVGDGTMTGRGKPVGLCSPESVFTDRFVSTVERYGDRVVKVDGSSARCDFFRVRSDPANRAGSGRGSTNSVKVRSLLRKTGLEGSTSKTKFVPEQVFMSDVDTIKAFLEGYFAADGHIGTHSIEASSVSHKLMVDLQELLLRVGVCSRVSKPYTPKPSDLVSNPSTAWRLLIAGHADISMFCNSLTVPGKSYDSLDVKNIKNRTWRTKNLNPGLRWEKVSSVEPLGDAQTIGIAVPGHHTYLSTFFEHNTFSNALEEGKVFWMETMSPHLALIARSFDKLDDSYYIDFDTSNVPILVLAKHERETYYMSEFQAGLISANEYREASGRKRVVSDVADSLLANPNQTPIANTEKPMNQETGMQEGVPLDVQASEARQAQVTEFSPEEGAFVTAGSVEGTQMIEASAEQSPSEFEDAEGKQLFPLGVSVDVKAASFVTWESKAASFVKSAEDELSDLLDVVFDEQEAAVIDAFDDASFAALMSVGASANFSSVIPLSMLIVPTAGLEPYFKAFYLRSVAESVKSGVGRYVSDAVIAAAVSEQISSVSRFNTKTYSDIMAALATAASLSGDDGTAADVTMKTALAYASVRAIFGVLRAKRKAAIHSGAVFGVYNQAVFDAGQAASVSNKSLSKTWVSLKDDRVRHAHRELHGKKVPFNSTFFVDGSVIRFPRDPLAPASLTVNCRCVLKLDKR